jgi:hypothetical protein
MRGMVLVGDPFTSSQNLLVFIKCRVDFVADFLLPVFGPRRSGSESRVTGSRDQVIHLKEWIWANRNRIAPRRSVCCRGRTRRKHQQEDNGAERPFHWFWMTIHKTQRAPQRHVGREKEMKQMLPTNGPCQEQDTAGLPIGVFAVCHRSGSCKRPSSCSSSSEQQEDNGFSLSRIDGGRTVSGCRERLPRTATQSAKKNGQAGMTGLSAECLQHVECVKPSWLLSSSGQPSWQPSLLLLS